MFTMETLREIWNDRLGERVEVGPDRDAVGLIEVRLVSFDDKTVNRMSFPAGQAKLLAKALELCANETEEQLEES